jgi:hypothetical protein
MARYGAVELGPRVAQARVPKSVSAPDFPDTDIGNYVKEMVLEYVKEHGSADVAIIENGPDRYNVELKFVKGLPPSYPNRFNVSVRGFFKDVDTVRAGFHVYTVRFPYEKGSLPVFMESMEGKSGPVVQIRAVRMKPGLRAVWSESPRFGDVPRLGTLTNAWVREKAGDLDQLLPDRPQYFAPVILPADQRDNVDKVGVAIDVGVLLPEEMGNVVYAARGQIPSLSGSVKEDVSAFFETIVEKISRVALVLEANELGVWIAQEPDASQWDSLSLDRKRQIVEAGILKSMVPGLWRTPPAIILDAFKVHLEKIGRGGKEAALADLPFLLGRIICGESESFVRALPTAVKLAISHWLPPNRAVIITQSLPAMGWRVINITACIYYFLFESDLIDVRTRIVEEIDGVSSNFIGLAKYLDTRAGRALLASPLLHQSISDNDFAALAPPRASSGVSTIDETVSEDIVSAVGVGTIVGGIGYVLSRLFVR